MQRVGFEDAEFSLNHSPDDLLALDEAITALEKDHDFLLEGGVFTQDVIDTWIDMKRTNEIEYVRLRPHPGEFALYFNV